MLIVDTHTHIFKTWAGINNGAPNQSAGYGRIQNGNKILQVMPPAFENSSCSVENLIANLDAHGVDKAVVFSNGGYGYHNEYLREAISRYPGRLAALALVDLPKGKQAADETEAYLKKGFLGLKYEGLSCFECSAQLALSDPIMCESWEVCNHAEAVVTFHVARRRDIGELAELRKMFPKIRMIVAHFGAEAVFCDLPAAWEELKDLVAGNENIWLETSSVSLCLGEQLSFEKTCAMIEDAVRHVGAEKVLWGSDYPCMALYATYYQMLHMIPEGCKEISECEAELIMGKNANQIFFR